MLPTLNEQQVELREHIIRFARAELNEGLVERDAEGTFNRLGHRSDGQPIGSDF